MNQRYYWTKNKVSYMRITHLTVQSKFLLNDMLRFILQQIIAMKSNRYRIRKKENIHALEIKSFGKSKVVNFLIQQLIGVNHAAGTN